MNRDLFDDEHLSIVNGGAHGDGKGGGTGGGGGKGTGGGDGWVGCATSVVPSLASSASKR